MQANSNRQSLPDNLRSSELGSGTTAGSSFPRKNQGAGATPLSRRTASLLACAGRPQRRIRLNIVTGIRMLLSHCHTLRRTLSRNRFIVKKYLRSRTIVSRLAVCASVLSIVVRQVIDPKPKLIAVG